jgi:hypothetical protein
MPARADAGGDQRAAAQALFDEARRLMADKRPAEACPKLEESQRLDPGLGTLLNLAECQAQVGKTASAWSNYLEAAYQAKNTGQTKREGTARAHAAALEPKLSKLTILAPLAKAGVAIQRDGAPLAASVVGVPVPVDPGEHTVSASAPGKKPWVAKVQVVGDGAQLTVSVPALEDADPSAPPPSASSSASSDGSAGRAQRVAGIVLGAVGVAGLAAGAAFAAVAKKKYVTSNQMGCDPATDVCADPGFSIRDNARVFGNAATGSVVVGGILAAGGAGLLVAGVLAGKGGPAPPTASAPPRLAPTVTAAFAPGRATFAVGGHF